MSDMHFEEIHLILSTADKYSKSHWNSVLFVNNTDTQRQTCKSKEEISHLRNIRHLKYRT